MPLNAEHEAMRNALNRFDDAVRALGGEAHPGAEILGRLVMMAVDGVGAGADDCFQIG